MHRSTRTALAVAGTPMVLIVKLSLVLTIGPFVLIFWGLVALVRVLARGLNAQPMRQGRGLDGPAQRHAERMAAIDARHMAKFGRTFNRR